MWPNNNTNPLENEWLRLALNLIEAGHEEDVYHHLMGLFDLNKSVNKQMWT